MTKEQRKYLDSVTHKLNDLREMRVQYAYEKVKNIINPTTDVGTDIFLKYLDSFLFGGPSSRKHVGRSDLAEARNDRNLMIDLHHLEDLHSKLIRKGGLHDKSSFDNWIKTLYEDPSFEFVWKIGDSDDLATRDPELAKEWHPMNQKKTYDLPIKEVVKGGDVTKGAFIDKGDAIFVEKMPELRPDVKSLLFNLKTIFQQESGNPTITIIPVAQNKLLVLTLLLDSTGGTTASKNTGKTLEQCYLDVLQKIFHSSYSGLNSGKGRSDFTGESKPLGNNGEVLTLEFEFKCINPEDVSKKDKFLSVANKRVERANQTIRSFKNFYSRHNKRNYDFSKEDFIEIDRKITKALELFRKDYQDHFKEKDMIDMDDRELEKRFAVDRNALEGEARIKRQVASLLSEQQKLLLEQMKEHTEYIFDKIRHQQNKTEHKFTQLQKEFSSREEKQSNHMIEQFNVIRTLMEESKK